MSITLTNETKVSLALTNEDKGKDLTWDEATFAWEDAGAQTWDSNGYLMVTKESKNALSLTNESKT